MGAMTISALAPLEAFPAHSAPVNQIAFAENGEVMATSDTGMVVKIWRQRELVRKLDLRSNLDKVRPTERIRGIQFTSDDNLIVAAGEQVASYKVTSIEDNADWSYVAPRLLAFLIISPTSIAVSPGGKVAATFDNGTIVSWDGQGVRRSIIRHNAVPRFLKFLPDESLIGTDSFSLSRWMPDERRPIWHRPSKERIYGMAVSSDGRFVALRRLYSTVVYDIVSGEPLAEHKQGRGLPLVCFAPGSHVFALGTQHAIHVYDLVDGGHQRLGLDDAELISLSFVSDRKQVVAGCSDGRIRRWDLSD